MIRTLKTEINHGGWKAIFYDGVNISQLLPSGLVKHDKHADDPTLKSSDSSILIRAMFESFRKTVEMHKWLANNHHGPDEIYLSVKKDRIIAGAILKNGKTAYLRSDKSDGYYVSILIQTTSEQKRRGQLIASSLRRGNQAELAFPSSGILAAALAITQGASPQSSADSTPKAIPKPPATTRIQSGGTGFYVNNTDIVTAAHLVNGCESIRLEDGSKLRIIDTDAVLDLAILAADKRSLVWLSLSAQNSPKLGEGVFAIGFPYRGLYDQGVSVTGGNISALPRINSPEARVMVTAPVQPGNSGGPLLNSRGQVIGVIVSRANALNVLETRGGLPQNMNFAVPIEPLVKFLNERAIFFPVGDHDAQSIENGIPERIQKSVIPILCH